MSHQLEFIERPGAAIARLRNECVFYACGPNEIMSAPFGRYLISQR
jgi:hypothetical protein